MLNRIVALIWKEILAIWRDPTSRGAVLAPPLIQLFIFTFAATLDVKNVPIGILNLDNGEQSIELVQRFHGTPFFNHIYYLRSVKEIDSFIDTQKGVMVVFIDEQFSRNLDAKKTTTVQLILDGRKSNTSQIVAGYTSQILNQFNIDFNKRMRYPEQNAQLNFRAWFNPNLLYYWYNVPSLTALLTMTVALFVTSISVARERELGTFDQLLVSPLQPIEILLGKMVPGIIIGMFEGSMILTVGVFIFQVPFTGSLFLFYVSLFFFVSTIVGVGLFISSLCSNQQQAILGTFIFMTPSVLLAGYATPIENMPTWLQPASYLIPFRYMLIIAKGIFLKDLPVHIILNNIWPMILIAIFTTLSATILFRKKLE